MKVKWSKIRRQVGREFYDTLKKVKTSQHSLTVTINTANESAMNKRKVWNDTLAIATLCKKESYHCLVIITDGKDRK